MPTLNRKQARELGIDVGGGASKYSAKRTEWRGRTYDSKIEARYAEWLHGEMEAGRIVEIIEQPRVTLTEGFDYRPDFFVVPLYGDVSGTRGPYYIDVKGHETQRFRDAKRLWKAHGRLPLVVVKVERGRLVPAEEIHPREASDEQ